MGWYWALSGWQWIVATVGMLSALIVSVLSAVAALGKYITSSVEHDAQTCECNRCMVRRAKAWNRANKQIVPPTPQKRYPGMWLTTTQLIPGDVVSGRVGIEYRVWAKDVREYGYVVQLQAVYTRNLSLVTVPLARADVKMWRLSGPPPPIKRLTGM